MTASRTTARRVLTVLFAVPAPVLLAACGSDAQSSGRPVGTPENPAVGQRLPGGGEPTEASAPRRGTAQTPSYDGVVKSQKRRPRERFTPCNLVTKTQARAILGAAVHEPSEAPQGPTCIYRTGTGSNFVTLALQSADMADLKRHLRGVKRVEVSSRVAYCGKVGQPVLYVPLSGGRVLSIFASCKTAQQFASIALSRLKS